jgi:autotransporter-associated beta strand protein
MSKATFRKSSRKSTWQTLFAGAIVAAVAIGGSSSALAAPGSWRGTTNSSWATTGNWSGASPPTTSELATFNGAGNGNTTIDLGGGVTVRSLVFDSANAAAYTIGSGAVGSQTLTLNIAGWNQEQGGITVNSTVTNNQLFNANVVLGDASAYNHYITNSSPTATLTLAGNVSGGTGGTAGAKTLYLGGAGNTTISGTIGRGGATTLALNKTGAGTLTLSGSNTYNGTTTLNQGTINLDFSAATAPAANIISATPALSLTGGTLRLTGKASTINSQTVASTSVGAGHSAVSLNANSATSLLLDLKAISRSAGGTLDVTLPTGSPSSTNGVITSSTSNLANSVLVSAASNGIAYATVGGSDWAGISGSNIVAMTTYQTAYSTNNNVNVTDGDSASGATVNTLRFNGNNTLNLSGTNTVNTGGILVTNAATTGATISGGALRSGGGREMVLINNGAQLTVGSVIADSSGGASALTLSGTGTTILNGVNTYTGNTFINNGTVKAGSSQALGVNSNVTLSNNASSVLDLNGNNLTIGALNATGVLIQPVSPTGYGTMDLSAASVALGANTLTVGAVNASSTFGGSITGVGGSLVKIGTGGLVLNGSNSFTGGITIRAGSVTGNGYLNGGATFGSGGQNTLGTGTITLGDSTGGGAAATLNVGGLANSNMTYTNALVLAGTNALTLRTPNSNTTISFNGNVTGTNSLTVSSAGGAFYVSGNFNNFGNLSFNGVDVIGVIGANVQNVTIVNGRGGQTVQMNPINNTGTFTHSNATGAKTTLGSIGSNVTAFINSAGTLELGGQNAFAGNTLLNGGTLVLMDNNALQMSGLDTSGAGVINTTSRTQPTFGGLIGSKNIASVITTGYSAITALTLNPQAGRSYTYSGIIGNGAAGMTLTKSGPGTQVLSGSNSYSGATTVSTGMLQFGKAASLYGGTTANWTATNIRTGSGATLAFSVGGTDEFTTGNVTTLLTNLANSTSVTNGMNAGSILGFDTTNAAGGTFTISDAIANSGGISGGARGLRKLGTGSLVLSGSNTYTGATTVEQGSLLVNGQLSTSAVTVRSGGLFGGSGTLGNVDVLAGGTFSPGNSPGLISLSQLALAGTTLMEIDGLTRGTQYDAVDVSGLITYGGSMVIDFGSSITSAFADNTTFNLFAFGSYSGQFSGITTANDGSWYGGLTFVNSGDNNKWTAEIGSQTLEFTHSTGALAIVPEPGALALAGIGIAAAWASCSRRRSRTRVG